MNLFLTFLGSVAGFFVGALLLPRGAVTGWLDQALNVGFVSLFIAAFGLGLPFAYRFIRGRPQS